jgi:hypothetical protein
MRRVKKWGIKIDGQWLVTSDSEETNAMSNAIYFKRSAAIKDVDDFNSMRTRGDNPYTVEEYKK